MFFSSNIKLQESVNVLLYSFREFAELNILSLNTNGRGSLLYEKAAKRNPLNFRNESSRKWFYYDMRIYLIHIVVLGLVDCSTKTSHVVVGFVVLVDCCWAFVGCGAVLGCCIVVGCGAVLGCCVPQSITRNNHNKKFIRNMQDSENIKT